MAMTFDATLKDMGRASPVGFLTAFDRPPTAPVKLLNVDLSTVTAAADLILGLGEPLQEIVQMEFQASAASDDAFEARVEVLDSTGTRIGYDPAKSFYPQGWTQAQIQEAIYSAFVGHYKGGGASFFLRMRLTTPKGVKIWMRVSGNQSAAGITLTGIATAYLDQGQKLTSTDAP
jgi:hypothetical protein